MADAYVSKPLMQTRMRRLFTFSHALTLSVDGARRLATAAEGIEDDSPTEGRRFLVLDAYFDPVTQKMRPVEPVIAIWVNATVIASEQINAATLTPVKRLPGVENGCGDRTCGDCYEQPKEEVTRG